MDKMCIKFKKKYNLSIFQKDRLNSHVDNHIIIEEVFNTAVKYQIDMPITQTLLQLIRKEMTPQQVAERLMERSARFE